MAESIRSLIVKLGYDVDTTGATIFRSSFDSVKKSLSGLGKTYDKSLKQMAKSNNMFVVTAGDVVNAVKRVASIGKDIFFKFADIQQARVTLAFRTSQKEADNLIKKVGEITKATGGYVSQLDALNAVSFGGNITGQTEFFITNLDKIIKLSKVAGKDFNDTSDAIARFIETGTGLDQLVEFKIITAGQKEALEKSGASGLIGQQGIQARTAQAQQFLTAGAPRVDQFFKGFQKTGGAAIDQLSTSAENFAITVGKELNPAVTEFVGNVKKATDDINEVAKKQGLFSKEFFGTLFGGTKDDPETRKRLGVSYDYFFGEKNKTEPVKKIESKKEESTRSTNNIRNSTQNNSQVVNDNSVTNINVNGTGNPEEVANKVMAKQAKRVIENNVRRTVPQSLNTSISTK